MFERIKRLFDSGKIKKDGLKNAVKNGLITKDEFKLICGDVYDNS